MIADSADDVRIPLVAGGLRRILEERCPNIDEVALHYSALAQDCFLSGHDEAAVVMLGAASELLLLQLAEALNAKRAVLGTSEIRGRNASDRVNRLKREVETQRGKLKAIITSVGGEARWLDELPGLLDSANAIRITRNAAGHPTRIVARREEAQGLLTLFPTLAEAVVSTATAIDQIS